MALNLADFKRYKSEIVSDDNTNGGRMSTVAALSGVYQNVWPVVGEAERQAGSNKFRKLFHKIENADDSALTSAFVFLERPTPGDDMIFIFPGTQIDSQGDLTGSEARYGAGTLNASVNAGATSIDVLVEDPAVIIFRDSDQIRISDKTSVNDPTNNVEYVTISGAPTIVGNVVTINFTPALANGYASGTGTVVSSMASVTQVAADKQSVVLTSAAGVFDENQLTVHHKGGIYQVWDIDFTSSTAFDLTGDALGAVASGNVSSAFAPVNPDTGTPYFTINAIAWSGSFVAGDNLTFITIPAAVGVWENRIVPVGAASIAAFSRIVVLKGQNA